MARISILGTGAMGSRMAMTLLAAGHAVTVWNRSPDKTESLVAAGAQAFATPRFAVTNADFAISMVRDDDASRQVWLDPDTGALENLPKHAIAIESSTISVAWAQALNQACVSQGISFLDAPVAGSRKQVEDAQLIYFVGGEVAAVAMATSLLKTMGSVMHHVGPAGNGAAIKLVVNTLFGVQIAAMSELIGFLQRCKLDINKVVEAMSLTPVCSRAAKIAADAMVARNFAPMFPIELMEKDLRYFLKTAAASNATTPVAQAAQHVFAKAMACGHGDDNITGLVQLYDRYGQSEVF